MQGQRTREGRNEGKCSLMCHTQIVQSDQITLFLYYVYCYIKNANYMHSAFLYVHRYVLQFGEYFICKESPLQIDFEKMQFLYIPIPIK